MNRKRLEVLVKGTTIMLLASATTLLADGISVEARESTQSSKVNEYAMEASSKSTSRSILGQATSTAEQMRTWAKNKGATNTFISLAEKYVNLASKHGGVNPTIAYAQSAIETGYGHFGGVINESYKNPCGMKTNGGGGDKDPNAHQRFDSWEDGIGAHLDHLALYAGASGYPRKDTKDPRHFPSILGKAKTIGALSGSWASDKEYGNKIARLVKEIEGSGGGTENPKPEPPKPPVVATKTGVVTASVLNMRSGPGTGYAVIGSLRNGKSVEIVETVLGWYKIKNGSGYGYVSSDYVRVNGTGGNPSTGGGGSTSTSNGTVTASALNVRAGAGTGHRVIGSLRNGATVEIVETSNGWHKIKYGSSYGYVSAEYVRANGSSGGNPSTGGGSTQGREGRVTASALNVRSGAGTNNRIIGSLRNGAVVQIVETSNGWHKIKYGSGYGFVSAQYIK